MRARGALAGLILALASASPASFAQSLNVERLEPAQIEQLQAVMRQLEPLITARKQDGSANRLTWEELLASLSPESRAFIAAMRAIKAESLGSTSHYFGEAAGAHIIPVGPQYIRKGDTQTLLDLQVLPRNVLVAYETMMAAMRRDLGKRLLVESGYRAPAYQLYLFLFYLPKHGYSIRETNRFVALPGYSEHGYPPRQAIDFINEDGVNGEDHPEEFEQLPEYRWLAEHAGQFGFVLSYPRDNALHTAFEPWHWHYEGS